MGKTADKFPTEVRERAVRLILHREGRHPSRWTAVCSIAANLSAACWGWTNRYNPECCPSSMSIMWAFGAQFNRLGHRNRESMSELRCNRCGPKSHHSMRGRTGISIPRRRTLREPFDWSPDLSFFAQRSGWPPCVWGKRRQTGARAPTRRRSVGDM